MDGNRQRLSRANSQNSKNSRRKPMLLVQKQRRGRKTSTLTLRTLQLQAQLRENRKGDRNLSAQTLISEPL